MRWRRFFSLIAAMLFAVSVLVGFDARGAEAKGFRGGSHGGSHRGFHHGKSHHGGFRHHGFHHGHRFHRSGVFFGLGLGLGLPYAYTAPYPAYSYAPYPTYYGPCYGYDAYGRCVSYVAPGGYY